MSAVPWIIAGGVVVVGGAIFVAVRNERAKQPEAGLCESAQPIAAALGYYIPGQACGVINAAADVVLSGLAEQEAAADAKNRQLNGEIDVPLDAATKSIAIRFIQPSVAGGGAGGSSLGSFGASVVKGKFGGRIERMLRGTVLRFKNGGVPFKGHPDFAKCVPGTIDMANASAGAEFHVLVTPGRVPSPGELASHEAGKYMRNRARFEDMFTGLSSDPTTSKELGIVAGKKWPCPPGQVVLSIAAVRDQRTDAGGTSIQVTCGAAGTTPPQAPPVVGGGTSTPVAPGPNYEWVATPAPGHWQRKRA